MEWAPNIDFVYQTIGNDGELPIGIWHFLGREAR